ALDIDCGTFDLVDVIQRFLFALFNSTTPVMQALFGGIPAHNREQCRGIFMHLEADPEELHKHPQNGNCRYGQDGTHDPKELSAADNAHENEDRVNLYGVALKVGSNDVSLDLVHCQVE